MMTMEELKKEVRKYIKDVEEYDLQTTLDFQQTDKGEEIINLNIDVIVEGNFEEFFTLESFTNEDKANKRLKAVEKMIKGW